MKYVINDGQCGRLMGDTDITPLSFDDCIKHLLSYHSIDHTKEELKEVELCYRKNHEYAEIYIEEIKEQTKTWKEITQIANIKHIYSEEEFKSFDQYEILEAIADEGMDNESMTLLFEDNDYLLVNYNEFGTSLHFLNIVDKHSQTSKVIEI